MHKFILNQDITITFHHLELKLLKDATFNIRGSYCDKSSKEKMVTIELEGLENQESIVIALAKNKGLVM